MQSIKLIHMVRFSLNRFHITRDTDVSLRTWMKNALAMLLPICRNFSSMYCLNHHHWIHDSLAATYTTHCIPPNIGLSSCSAWIESIRMKNTHFDLHKHTRWHTHSPHEGELTALVFRIFVWAPNERRGQTYVHFMLPDTIRSSIFNSFGVVVVVHISYIVVFFLSLNPWQSGL